jgi:hypothetical protein
MDRRRFLWAMGIVAAALAAFIGWKIWSDARALDESSRVARERERREEARAQRREESRWRNVRRESEDLMPEPIAGVALGMTRAEVARVRPSIAPDERMNEPGMLLEAENLGNGARVIYAFEAPTGRLQRVQILSQLPSLDALAPHLQAMNERYEQPTGAWDCPDTGGVPTRRFTWRRAHTTVSDVFLVYPRGVAVTLYVAPNDVIRRSLELGHCRPIRDREELERFPVASEEQIRP